MYGNILTIWFILLLSVFSCPVNGQNNSAEGKLFIVGGGERPGYLIEAMVNTADLRPDDYIVVLPMASKKPANGVKDIKEQIAKFCENPITGFNFCETSIERKQWIDSVKNARLIYIVGGSQRRFMNVVLHTPVYSAIHRAFEEGSTIAGTSAGAAVMSKIMITGRQKQKHDYKGFESILYDNVETGEGLGLLPSHTIIDQHFIKRSRQNRLISVLADFPHYECIGIDESTAIICKGKEAKVIGEGQVTVLSDPEDLSESSGKLVKFSNIRFSLLTSGDTIKLK